LKNLSSDFVFFSLASRWKNSSVTSLASLVNLLDWRSFFAFLAAAFLAASFAPEDAIGCSASLEALLKKSLRQQ